MSRIYESEEKIIIPEYINLLKEMKDRLFRPERITWDDQTLLAKRISHILDNLIYLKEGPAENASAQSGHFNLDKQREGWIIRVLVEILTYVMANCHTNANREKRTNLLIEGVELVKKLS